MIGHESACKCQQCKDQLREQRSADKARRTIDRLARERASVYTRPAPKLRAPWPQIRAKVPAPLPVGAIRSDFEQAPKRSAFWHWVAAAAVVWASALLTLAVGALIGHVSP